MAKKKDEDGAKVEKAVPQYAKHGIYSGEPGRKAMKAREKEKRPDGGCKTC